MSASGTPARLSRIIEAYPSSRRHLLPLLQEIQAAIGHLSPDAVDAVAAHLRISPHEVFGVATFYSQFWFNKPGRHCLKVCDGTACHVRGSSLLTDVIAQRLHVEVGQTTTDEQFSLQRVMCVGSCALAPVVVCDDVVRGRLTQKKLEQLLRDCSDEARP
jgi:NADH-quinone oxidoreductase subunit E